MHIRVFPSRQTKLPPCLVSALAHLRIEGHIESARHSSGLVVCIAARFILYRIDDLKTWLDANRVENPDPKDNEDSAGNEAVESE